MESNLDKDKVFIEVDLSRFKQKERRERLLDTVKKVKDELDLAYKNLEFVLDDDLVDSYIYEVQAIQKRYDYFLREAKKIDLEGTIV